MPEQEAQKIALDVERKLWLEQHGRTPNDVMTDETGEYICLDKGWIRGQIKCELIEYLPEELTN